MFVDQLIPRLRNAGLTVHDVRGQLPRRGRWMARPVSAIQIISHHHDAEWRAHDYDTMAKITAQANYHINKDWGGGARGDGLMYAWQVDNVGDVYITRDFEDVLWSVGDANYRTVSGCWHGTLGQAPTREQIETMQKMDVVLTTQCPEFPAERDDVLGHREVPGNSTACNGEFLPATQQFRAEGNAHPERYTYDWGPTTPTPPPTTPPPVPEPPKPTWHDIVDGSKSMVVNQDTTLFDTNSGAAYGDVYAKGRQIDNLVQEIVIGATTYWRTAYSKSKNVDRGFKREHLSPIDNPPIPAPDPDPVPVPDPKPNPDPTPEPEYPNWFVAFWNKVIEAIKSIIGGK